MRHRTVTPSSMAPGFTLLETSIVLAVLAVLVAVVMPAFRSHDVERLRAAGQMLAADLRLARSLAVRDASPYTLTLTAGGWKIEHSGLVDAAHPAPDLPASPIGGTGSGYATDVDRLLGGPVTLVARLAGTETPADSVTFQPTGRTAAVPSTVFWLSLGEATAMRSLKITVSPATGFVRADEPRVGSPPSVD